MSRCTWPLRIAGLGRYLPERIVTNAELEELCLLEPGDIDASGAGVRERRWCTHETTSQMAALAAREALDEAGIGAGELDLILSASGSPQQAVPDGGALVQQAMGLGQSAIPAMAVHTTCLGFLTALDVAASFMASGRYRRILVVNSDIVSRGINPNQPSSAVLFGDAATAAVLVAPETGEETGLETGLEAIRFETYGEGASYTQVRGGGTLCHPNDPATRKRDNFFDMNGRAVMEMGLRYFPGFLQRFRPNLMDGVDWVLPHQASGAALAFLTSLGVPAERLIVTLPTYGNTVSSSIPLALTEAVRDGRIQRGQRLLLVGSGAGLTFGAALLRY